jgi:signal transduction histidine kinase/ligand-binding sensor domain-containing protein
VRIRWSFALCVLLFVIAALPLRAVDPTRHLSQYAHTAWRVQDGGLKAAPSTITQTSDGYIWIGTFSGLVRFDGVRFVPWTSPDRVQLPSSQIYSLLGARDGTLWIGTREGLSHWVNQHLVNYPGANGLITSILEDHDGTIWFTHLEALDGSGLLCKVIGTGKRCYGVADGVPGLSASLLMGADSLGNLWIGGDTALVRWRPGSSTVYRPHGLKANDAMQGVTGFAEDTDGSLWAGMAMAGSDMGLQHFVHGAWQPFISPELDGRTLKIRTLFMDSHHALWIGSDTQGIYRIFAQKVEHFQPADGFTSNMPTHFCEDREGNVWVTTHKGIDKFSDLQVATYSVREGLATDEVDAVLAARDGTVWIGGSEALDAIRDGKVTSIRAGKGLPGNQVTSLLEDHKCRLWVGINSTLTIHENGRLRPIDKPDRTPFGVITDMTEDTDGNIWLETIGPPRSLIRIHDDKVQEQFPVPQMPAARRVAADPSGGIWIGTRKGDLVRYRNGHSELIAFQHNPDSQVEQLLVDPDGGMMAAAAFGVMGWKAGKKQMLTVKNGLPCNSVLAMIPDDAGNMWFYAQCGLVEIASSELKKWWQQPDAVLKTTVFDEFDGFQPGWAPFQRVARTADGRLWFANGSVLQMIDPHHRYENALAPPVHIEAVIADRKSFLSSPALRLPALTRDLEIDYTALSFMVPQKVRFRYKLDGHDTNWQEPGTRRQAFYDDLGPGTFTFHVIACNNDGVWNETGASLTFTVAPAWYQTIWFRLLAVFIGIATVWAIYQFRVRRIASDLASRFDDRLGERTRLARELHDTFLQTVQGSKMVADDALDPDSDEPRMRKALEKLSVWLEQAVDEGRAALHSLRVTTVEKNQLAEALQRATENPQIPASMTVTFSVIGDAVDLHPVVRDDVYRIAFEAIRNAAVHSHASLLEIDLRYGDTLSVRIKDNGIGIDPTISDHGKAGHFGLQGMRERAARIHSKLTVVSSTNAGTEVALIVPGKVVYRNALPTLKEKIMRAVNRLLGHSAPIDK